MDQEIRQVAEQLIHSGSHNIQSPGIEISHSHSIHTIPSLHPDYIISEDLLAGHRTNGRMSTVRRFFCMFVTFDLLFISLMWLICVMLKGENIMKALNEQIYHYNIHTSLFDVVLAALCRFVVLLLFYGLIYMNHWFIVSISTTLTCVFLISKVFVYDWPHSAQPVFEVLLVLASFVLSWGEAWFLDFRVLPQESHARRFLISNSDSERAPLIRSYVNGLPSLYTESVGNFYSPLGSPEGSMYRFNSGPVLGRYPPVQLTSEQEDNYKSLAARTMQEAWDLLHKKDWKLEKACGSDSVYTMTVPKIGKVFKLIAYLDVTPKFLLDELFYRVETLPQWNSTLLESHKVQVIDEHTDISYQIGADGAAGVVSSRDFVNLRHWDVIEGRYVIACVGTEHPSLPKNDKYIRGENRAGCWAMQEDPNDPNKCIFQWVLNTNLNGWIPQYVRDTAFVGMMFDYVKHLKQHIAKQRENGRL
jgi:hypothetical protein